MINKYSLGLILLLVVTLVIVVTFSEFRLRSKMDDLDIKGIVEKIEIREKGISYYRINQEWISFSYLGDGLQNFLLEGDSISKQPGEMRLKVFRKSKDHRYNELRTVEF